MPQKLFTYMLFFCFCSLQAQRQSILKNDEEAVGYNKLPHERIFVHYNTPLLFSGEYLYYSVYCFNTRSKKFSDISKVAYVELIDQTRQPVFKQKIKLEKGQGQGDFFIKTNIPSGNYKLIGYTQWMLNGVHRPFFLGDLSILNPYQGNQKSILSKSSATSLVDPISQNSIPEVKTKSDITLALNSQNFEKRSLVSLKISGKTTELISGKYSISVHKKASFPHAKTISAKDFTASLETVEKEPNKSNGTPFFLPEIRGELVYGSILAQNEEVSIANIPVGLSIPGVNDNIKVVSTDTDGKFVFILNKEYVTNQIIIQVLGNNRKDYNIQLSQFPEIEYPQSDFYNFRITKDLQDSIIQRSVYNQIDNIFYSIKPDSISTPEDHISFYGLRKEEFHLDDYTRFNTIKETVTEVVSGVGYRKNLKGKNVFYIDGKYPGSRIKDLTPLLIVDGILVQEHEEFLEYDARKVKTIRFIRDRYFLGSRVFEGILSASTIKGNYMEELNKNYLFQSELIRPARKKKYYQQIYKIGDTTYNRIPDYRHQLLWKPDIIIESNETYIDFYTSDTAGTFEISLEGFTDNGFPVSIKKLFYVK